SLSPRRVPRYGGPRGLHSFPTRRSSDLGEEVDRLVLGLATVGLAVTAATYVSIGGVGPVRAGLSMVKDARKVGRLGEGLTQWAGDRKSTRLNSSHGSN